MKIIYILVVVGVATTLSPSMRDLLHVGNMFTCLVACKA